MAFSPDGTRLYSAGQDLHGCLWDTKLWQPQQRLEGHWKAINSAAFSTDGTQLASGSNDGTLRTWKASTGEPIDCWQHDGPVLCVAACPRESGCWFTASNDQCVRRWTTRRAEPHLVSRGNFEISCLAVARNTATASRKGDERVALAGGKQVTVVSLSDGEAHEARFDLEGCVAVHDIVFSPDGQRLYVAVDASIRSLDLNSRSWQTLLKPTRTITTIDVTSDESTFATGGARGIIWLRPVPADGAATDTDEIPDAPRGTAASSPISVRCLGGFTLWCVLMMATGFAGACLGLVAAIIVGPFLVPSFAEALLDDAGWVPVVQRTINAATEWTGWITAGLAAVPAAVIASAWMKNDWSRAIIPTAGARTTCRLIRPISIATGVVVLSVATVQWQRDIPLIGIGFTIVLLLIGVAFPLIYLSWFSGQCLGLRCKYRVNSSDAQLQGFHALLDEASQRGRRQLDRAIAFGYGLLIPGISCIMVVIYLWITLFPSDGTASGHGCRTTDFDQPQYVPVDQILRDFSIDHAASIREYVGYKFQFRGIVENWQTGKLRLRIASGETAALCLLDDETAHSLLTNQFRVEEWERVQLQVGQSAILFGECTGRDAQGVIQFRNCCFHYSTFYPGLQTSLDRGTRPPKRSDDDSGLLTGAAPFTAYAVALVSGALFLLWLRASRKLGP